MTINFASDNAAPACPEMIDALVAANNGPALGYGDDEITQRMEDLFRETFERDLRVFPVATGTAANVLSLSVLSPPYGAVYCHNEAHIEGHECGAPEFFTGGAKLVLLAGKNGKLCPTELDEKLTRAEIGNVHHVQPSVVSLTQVTENGGIYTADEVAAVCQVAKKYGLTVHMDGARFANAAAALNVPPADITWKAGVDVLSFGGTKNGALSVEGVVFFNTVKAAEFEFRRKRGAHLFSKMRYLSAQLEATLQDDLWLRTARHANAMASRLAEGISGTDFSVLNDVEANIVFAKLSEDTVVRLEKAGFLFYVMGPRSDAEVRLVTSWNTTADEVDSFVQHLNG